MKNNNKFGFLIGFLISCFLHAGAVTAYFYYIDAKDEGIKSEIRAPLKLSLNMFQKKPQIEEIAEVKPIQPKPKPKPKKQPIPKLTPVITEQQPIQEIVETIEEILEEDTSQEVYVEEAREAVQEQISVASSINEDDSYKLLIAAAIEKYTKNYPSKARHMNMQGIVSIKLKINANGKLEFVEIIDSSGHGILDSHTIKSVKRASREFPKPPREMTFNVPISYELI